MSNLEKVENHPGNINSVAFSDPRRFLGMSDAQVEAVLGQPDEVAPFEEDNTVYLTYLCLGLSILLKQQIVDAVFAYSGRVGGYETMKWSRFQGTFPCDIHWDLHIDEVVRRLGPPEHSVHFPDAPIPYRSVSYPSLGIGFTSIEASGEIIYIITYSARTLTTSED